MSAPAAQAPDPYLTWALASRLAGHSALATRPANGYLPLLFKAPLTLADKRSWRVPPYYAQRPDIGFWTAWVPAAAVDTLQALDADFAMALPLLDEVTNPSSAKPIEPGPEDTPVIGVIDNGCAFVNQVFSEVGASGRSRFLSLWRQRPTADKTQRWHTPADFGYGLELAGRDIPAGEADEATVYARFGYPLDEQQRLRDMLHGTHVLDIAAGLPQDLPDQASAKPASPDRACEARLVFVELPEPLAADTTGAGLDAFILDAVHYVLHRAGPGRRVIINLSLGAQAGPHDGGSLVEQALDQLIQDEGGRLSICVAAGNGAEEHWHASGTLEGDGGSAAAGWRTVPGDTTDSFLELWATSSDAAALNGLTVTLTAPDGRALAARVGEAPRLLGPAPDDPPQALLDLRRMPDFGGRHRASALVSVAPTAGPRAGQAAGLWQVEVSRPPTAAQAQAPGCDLALWLQRDTPGRSLDEMLQSEFEVLSPGLRWNGRASLSHLAGASRLFTVGAACLSDSMPSSYSPRDGIDAWGMGDESPSVYGLLCSGGLSGSVVRLSGTSAATPMVARALANDLLAPQPTQKQSSWVGAAAAEQTGPLKSPEGTPIVRPGSAVLGIMLPEAMDTPG